MGWAYSSSRSFSSFRAAAATSISGSLSNAFTAYNGALLFSAKARRTEGSGCCINAYSLLPDKRSCPKYPLIFSDRCHCFQRSMGKGLTLILVVYFIHIVENPQPHHRKCCAWTLEYSQGDASFKKTLLP